MTDAERKEDASLGRLIAVCAKAGISVEIHRRDGDGIDGSLKKVARVSDGSLFATTINFQLKSTCLNVGENDDFISYDLKRKNYDDLKRRASTQNLLVVCFFKESLDSSIAFAPEALSIARCSYWIEAENLPESDAETSVRVKLPKANVDAPEILEGLFCRVAERSLKNV